MISTAAVPLLLLVAQPTQLVGTVRDTAGKPLPSAQIHVLPLARQATADAFGQYRLSVEPGGYTIVVTAEGFAPARRSIVVQPGTSRNDFTLARSIIALTAITVTATGAGHTVTEAGATVTAIGGGALERVMAGTLAATIGQQPGIHVRSQGPSAAMPVIRGLTGDRIVVLQDGQRAGDLAGSASDHGITIDPMAARRIEVVRGPATLLHGSNAVGGVVNVVSDDPGALVPPARVVSVAVSGETVSSGAAAWVDVQQPLGPVTATLRSGRRNAGNQRLGGGADGPGAGAEGRLENTSARNQTLDATLQWARPGARLAVGARHYQFEYGLPFRDDPAGAVRLDGKRREATVRAESQRAGRIERLELDGSVQRYAHDENLPSGVAATRLSLDSEHLRALLRFRDGTERSGSTIGASMQRRRQGHDGAAALLPPNTQVTTSLFALREFGPSERWRFPVSARVERADIRSASTETFGAERHRSFAIWSGSAGLVSRTSLHGMLTFTGSRAARLPAPEELFSRAGHAGTGAFEIGNPSLVPEVTRAVDLGWRLDHPEVRVQVAAFRTAVAGWIGLYPTGRDTTVLSGGINKTLPLLMISQRRARLAGMELEVERHVGRDMALGIATDVLRARDAAGAPLPYMPAARVSGTWRYDNRRLQAGATVRHVFAQGAVPVGELGTEAVWLADAWVGARWSSRRTAQSVLLRLDNATDRHWRDATSRAKDFAPNPGRGATLTWRVTF